MTKLIIISNRLSTTITRDKSELKYHTSAGGLSTGLASFCESDKAYDIHWIGWPGLVIDDPEEQATVTKHLKTKNQYPVFLSQDDYEKYYVGFCNDTLWPLFHYFIQYVQYDESTWKAYKAVNEQFLDAVLKVAEPGDIIWVHDYQLLLLPQLIRERIPSAAIGFFLHIPFPSYEVFRQLPWRSEVLQGILGADLVGFHTYDYCRHFLSSVYRLRGYESVSEGIVVGDHLVKVDAVPMGIDTKLYESSIQDPSVQLEMKAMEAQFKNNKIILSIDRLDYTKGIIHRLEAYRLFLEQHPEHHSKVILALIVVPSRIQVEQYQQIKMRIDEIVGNINGTFGTIGWTPIWYLFRFLPFAQLRALYNIADVGLITPMRDGMNLIAKEFIASHKDRDGVLILSEMAGAAQELGEAILVNPNNTSQVADAIQLALQLSEAEQIKGNKAMQRRLRRYDVTRWVHDYIDRLNQVKYLQSELFATKINSKHITTILDQYRQSNSRLLLLDYDGTLAAFVKNPEDVSPDTWLVDLIRDLAEQAENEVVIVSGRDRETLLSWFGDLPVGLIAEHGIWIREKSGKFELIEPLIKDWKGEIRQVLDLYEDRIPGSFVEEKEFALVWHYRKADPEQGPLAARELEVNLSRLVTNHQLEVQEGNKIIEVRKAGVNKGRAVTQWLKKRDWPFILAIGDDRTDEDMFLVLPDHTFSIKVGFTTTMAKYRIESTVQVRSLLDKLRKANTA